MQIERSTQRQGKELCCDCRKKAWPGCPATLKRNLCSLQGPQPADEAVSNCQPWHSCGLSPLGGGDSHKSHESCIHLPINVGMAREVWNVAQGPHSLHGLKSNKAGNDAKVLERASEGH